MGLKASHTLLLVLVYGGSSLHIHSLVTAFEARSSPAVIREHVLRSTAIGRSFTTTLHLSRIHSRSGHHIVPVRLPDRFAVGGTGSLALGQLLK